MTKRQVVFGHRTTHQVAFIGPYGVGKTTAVRACSSTPVVSTEMTAVSKSHGRHHKDLKDTTTVGLDYGEWVSPFGVIALYGTPGQARFQAARDQALAASSSFVLWLFGNRDDALDEAVDWLDYLVAGDLATRLTVAVTRPDETGGPSQAQFRNLLDRYNQEIVMTTADPRHRTDVERVVLSALRLPSTVPA